MNMGRDTEAAADHSGEPKRQYQMTARAAAAEATRESILDAARDAFSELPFDLATLSHVAEASGVTVQTVIRRFGSKEQLFEAVAERERARIVASRDLPADADLSEALDVLVDHYESDGDLVLHLLAQEHRVASIARAVEQGRRVHREWVEKHCAEALAGADEETRERRIHAAYVATDLGTWKLLRRDLGLPRDHVAAVMTELVNAMRGRT